MTKPALEARAWLVDLVAVGFFAPYTEALDQVDDDAEATELLHCELEKAFSAAEFAGELWDQRERS
ncbi:hypothetical protein [Streptomyces sp. NBC_01353]|uniref:hypothetical protein n=1 Tax=Streptomyces sp. NBC_01353 TaxID=2903835 RepID=UPI002E35BA33|nr:hypothetical protein [Streptomyces sp. NBC_01353]